MQLRSESFTFKDGRSLKVSQENWDISMTLADEQRKALASPLGDTRKQFFREKIYPVLFASSSGEVPTLDEAYAMIESAPDDLDGWYKIVQAVNPEWFTWLNHNPSEEVVFSDGSKVIVNDGNIPTGIMKIRDLEEDAERHPVDSFFGQVFRSTFYPKLAACSSGDVPDEETARAMPTTETNRWYEAVNRVNPHWFKALHELKKEVEAAELKKKRKRPRK